MVPTESYLTGVWWCWLACVSAGPQSSYKLLGMLGEHIAGAGTHVGDEPAKETEKELI